MIKVYTVLNQLLMIVKISSIPLKQINLEYMWLNFSENMAQNGGICVANHTSPIDVMILSTDNVYALIGQAQGGLLGWL